MPVVRQVQKRGAGRQPFLLTGEEIPAPPRRIRPQWRLYVLFREFAVARKRVISLNRVTR